MHDSNPEGIAPRPAVKAVYIAFVSLVLCAYTLAVVVEDFNSGMIGRGIIKVGTHITSLIGRMSSGDKSNSPK